MSVICPRKSYFDYKAEKQVILSVIQGTVDVGTETIEIFIPYPFQILGLSDVTQWPAMPPVSELPMNLSFDLKATGVQDSNAAWLQQMFSVMMYANRDHDDYSISPFLGSIEYEEYLFAKEAGYFKNFLNANLKPIFYNQFLFPPYEIVKFWNDEVTIASPATTMQRYRELASRLFELSDGRLWGAPGKYTIHYGPEIVTAELELVTEFCPI
jgi:hypothetical protein